MEPMSYIIWIDENLNNKIHNIYLEELELLDLLSFRIFTKIDEAINYMKYILFKETKVIIIDRLYSEFVTKFKSNIRDIDVAPKIIIFTKNKESFIKSNEEFQNNNNLFYKFGGIATTFDEIRQFLKIEIKRSLKSNIISENPRKQDPQLTFEYVDNIEKLGLPLFFKSLLVENLITKMKQYTNSLYNIYSKDNEEVQLLLGSIKSMKNIPIEILSKYYTRFYTAESNFYKDINTALRLYKKEKYNLFTKTLYQGIKLQSLPLSYDKQLYRGSIIAEEEVKKINFFLNKKINNLPGAIVFSKAFLSFSKDRKKAEKFLKKENKNKNVSKVLYILENNGNIDYNLSTHSDIENISFFPDEREVLFFPFSSFEVQEEVKDINKGRGEKKYEIKLLYLGKYSKAFEENKNIINKENKIPDSEFKKQLCESGLIEPEKIKNLTIKELYKEYKKYEKEIEENKIKKNIIIGEFNISLNDINKDIQIINSFENHKKKRTLQNKKDDYKYNNEKEIKEDIEIKINGKKIKFSYFYKFNKEGEYRIEYVFKKNKSKINYMFYNCKSLLNLNLSSFSTQNIIDMSYMFYNCNSLTNLNLSNFNTQNVTNMSSMFYNCNSLTNLNLSNFNTQNVTNMSSMFYNCNSLTDLNLSNFNTQNVTNMSSMFYNCKSLTNLNLSNFNTQNVVNMSSMFFDCNSLKISNIITKDKKILNNLENN